MSLKTKLVSTIAAICMVLALLTVGVWAVSTASVTLGGSVSFTADNVHARITGNVTGTQETISLPNLEYDVNTDVNSTDFQSKLSSWENNDMTFTSENLITMTITVENLSEERSLFVTLTDNATTTNVDKTLKQGTSNYTSETAVEVSAKGTTTFTMTLSVTDKNQSASAIVSYQVDLRDQNAPTPKLSEVELLYDSENNYYYVEMGTYNSQPVRWRYVSADGQTSYNATTTAPTIYEGDTGYFILETVTTTNCFGDSYYHEEQGSKGNNDYATSVIRQYITGHDCALAWDGLGYNGSIGNYLNDIGITEDNAVYSKIIARDVQDLYKNINWDGNVTISDGTTTTTGSDKLWIPSVAEIYSLVGGGDISNITSDWSEYYNKLAWNEKKYTLRSPGNLVTRHFAVDENGNCSQNQYVDYSCGVRPMFILEF